MVYFACQWFITLAVVWLYDFENAGNLALAMSITNIFYNIAIYNIRVFQVSDVSGEYSDKEYIVTRGVTCFGAFVLCAGFMFISGYPREQVVIVICYMIFRSVEAFIDVLHGVVHKHRRLDYAGISMIARGLLMLAAFCILGYFFKLLCAIAGMIVVTAIFGILYDVPRAKRFSGMDRGDGSPGLFRREAVFGLIRRCFLLMLVALIFTFYASYTRYALERIYGTEMLGAYASAVTPALALQLAVSFIAAPLINVFSDCIKESDRPKFIRVMIVSLAVAAGLTVIAVPAAYLIGPWGLRLLFGDVIVPYTYLLPGAMLVTGLMASIWLMNAVFSTIRDIKGIFFMCLAGVFCCIAASEIFLRRYGIAGANYALILCQAVVTAGLLIRFFWRLDKIWDNC